MSTYELAIQEAMVLAEKITALIYEKIPKEELDNSSLVLAIIWSAMAVGLKSDIEPPLLKVVVHYATEALLEDLPLHHETIH